MSVSQSPEHRIDENVIGLLESVCHRVRQLYPQLREIQYRQLPGKRISFMLIPETVLGSKIISEIQQAILTEISGSDYKCSTHDIRLEEPEETLRRMLNKKYVRDGVSVELYQGNDKKVIAIFGASSPLLKSEISGFMPAHLPENDALIQIRFMSEEGEMEKSIEPVRMRVLRRIQSLLNPFKRA